MTEPLLDVAELRKLYPVAAPGGFWRRLRSGADAVPKLHAVDDVSFTIAPGESLGLVGESGCGKSTLSRLVARLVDPTEGSIRFRGEELTHARARAFARHPQRGAIQLVFQDAGESINPRFTARDAIAEPLKRITGLRGPALEARVAEIAGQVGFPADLLTRFPHQLSGGQRARVGIGRAIATRPSLLVLDEPTAALDVSVQVLVLKLFARLRAELGMASLFVSHDLEVVRLVCDRVLVMYLGKVVESGPAGAVFERPLHPYTRALVAAIPRAGVDPATRPRLQGEPQSPIDPSPTMCRFASRCPLAQARCREEMPPLRRLPSGREVACHLAEEVAEAPAPAALASA
ncbi:MAG TPA: ABC transporter ATP-binding protein [Salinarimonas sp.]|nr:ABC transporter ATP-binding protein [Salinarimonas sp.]